jgi:CRISPR-associated protein Cas1
VAVQLVINTFGASVRRQGERFVVRAGGKEQAFSAHKVTGLLVATGATLTTDAVQLASVHNVDIVFLDKFGDPYARVWLPRHGSTTAIRRRQIEAAGTADGLGFARGWVEAKLRNQAEFLAELAQRRPAAGDVFRPALDGIADCLSKVARVGGTPDEARGTLTGLEGAAGRAYFECLSRLMPDGQRFTGRSRNPAKDGFNAMLNYGFGVLYAAVEKACILAGLDPCVGFLHADNYGKPSLAFDLIEPFRIIPERAVVLLFTGRRAQAGYFEPVPGGVGLTKDGRAAILVTLNERLDKAVRYPVRGRPGKFRNLKQRDVVRHEAHALANALIGRNDALTVVETRDVWGENVTPPANDSPLEVDEEPVVPVEDFGEAAGSIEGEDAPC